MCVRKWVCHKRGSDQESWVPWMSRSIKGGVMTEEDEREPVLGLIVFSFALSLAVVIHGGLQLHIYFVYLLKLFECCQCPTSFHWTVSVIPCYRVNKNINNVWPNHTWLIVAHFCNLVRECKCSEVRINYTPDHPFQVGLGIVHGCTSGFRRLHSH